MRCSTLLHLIPEICYVLQQNKMESQDSLIHSITHADEDDPRNDTIESVVPPAKSRFLILEPAILLLFFAWSVAGIQIAAIVLHNVHV